jgi:hypothetical protein
MAFIAKLLSPKSLVARASRPWKSEAKMALPQSYGPMTDQTGPNHTTVPDPWL